SMFLHASIAHVLGNLLFLWIFGNNIEDRMGPVPYLVFYLACGVAAALTFIGLNAHSVQPFLGASGAIAGVMGAYIIWFPRARVLSLLGFFPVYLPAFVVLGLWFGLQFFTNPNEGVACPRRRVRPGRDRRGALSAVLQTETTHSGFASRRLGRRLPRRVPGPSLMGVMRSRL